MKNIISQQKILFTAGMAVSLILNAGAAHAEVVQNQGVVKDRFAITPNLSTLGVGVQAEYMLTDQFVLRGGPSYFSWSHDGEIEGVEYDADLEMKNLSAIIDWHPLTNGWKVSAGAMYGDNKLDLVGTPAAGTTVEVGGTTYSGAAIGSITGEVETNNILPYVGTGYSGTFYDSDRWHFMADIGVMFAGSPKARLNSTGGLLSASPTLEADLREEEAEIEDFNYIKAYPVIGIGFSYRF